MWRGSRLGLRRTRIACPGVIAVCPIKSWRKDQPARDRSDKGARYALIVSIETDATDVDIWTPVANQLGLSVEAVAAVEM